MMGYELALYVSAAALALVSLCLFRLQLTALNAFQGTWVALIALPSALQYSGMHTAAKERLFLATTVVNLTLLIGALVWSTRWIQCQLGRLRYRVSAPPESMERGLSRWFWVAVAASLALFLFHAMLMPKIPLVELILRDDLTQNELTELREAANKLLPVPLALKYFLYWNMRVLVPILLTVLVLKGGKVARIIWSLLLVSLCAMTLEKSLPSFAILSCGLAVAIYRKSSLVSRPVVFGLVMGLGVATGLQTATKFRSVWAGQEPAAVMATDDRSSWQVPVIDGRNPEGSGLSWRELASYQMRYLGHRILTGPSDVAYAWFEYFPDIFGGFLYGQAWFVLDRAEPGFRHPANLVGLYAYHRKDPDRYLATAHAYGAFHADAWANFGYAGVAVASVVVASILMLAEVAMMFSVSTIRAGASGAGLSILLTTLPSGGVQAALVAQGLVICLAIALPPVWKQWQDHPGSIVPTG